MRCHTGSKLMNMKKIILLLIAVLVLTSCSRKRTLKHYVAAYALEVKENTGEGFSSVVQQDDDDIDGIIRVIFNPTKVVRWYNVSEAEYNEYLKYARQHNDLAWNKEVYSLDATDLKVAWFKFTANQVIDITVTAESDWDVETPKGSSLDDKFLFLSGSPDEFLKNGYKLDTSKIEAIKKTADPRLEDTLNFYIKETLQTSLPVYGVLSEINFSDYQLLGFGKLWFSLMPVDELTKGADISINIKFDNGKVITYNHKCK